MACGELPHRTSSGCIEERRKTFSDGSAAAKASATLSLAQDKPSAVPYPLPYVPYRATSFSMMTHSPFSAAQRTIKIFKDGMEVGSKVSYNTNDRCIKARAQRDSALILFRGFDAKPNDDVNDDSPTLSKRTNFHSFSRPPSPSPISAISWSTATFAP
ncbi:hypothetical protein LIPSTDRAFT_28881 [Lipomyces starkeyi NRRL Y-11557]|uniref:Uncharacterized protein n=1 Tax=Lipomyces starkeyi NRRL Y-11557 TaxID=675824 RepID=A0A1E3Q1R0_LIPST|nr:hypothetical protein LIPSTDRAFT_28881 [Lipomyces starkeyi NRRL Y-11557]